MADEEKHIDWKYENCFARVNIVKLHALSTLIFGFAIILTPGAAAVTRSKAQTSTPVEHPASKPRSSKAGKKSVSKSVKKTRESITPVVTKDNFGALVYRTLGPEKTMVEVVLRYNRSNMNGSLGAFWMYQEWHGQEHVHGNVDTLPDADYDNLVRLVIKSQFPSRAGKYAQKGPSKGTDETMVLWIEQPDYSRHKYQVDISGNAAPPALHELRTFLKQLTKRLKAEPVGEQGLSPMHPDQ